MLERHYCEETLKAYAYLVGSDSRFSPSDVITHGSYAIPGVLETGRTRVSADTPQILPWRAWLSGTPHLRLLAGCGLPPNFTGSAGTQVAKPTPDSLLICSALHR